MAQSCMHLAVSSDIQIWIHGIEKYRLSCDISQQRITTISDPVVMESRIVEICT